MCRFAAWVRALGSVKFPVLLNSCAQRGSLVQKLLAAPHTSKAGLTIDTEAFSFGILTGREPTNIHRRTQCKPNER